MTSNHKRYTQVGVRHIRDRCRLIALAALIAMLPASALFAQTNQGAIAGVVTDSSGAVVPNANITAKETATGTVYNTVSSSAGTYIIANARIGKYDVSAEFSGFKKWQATGVVVQ